MILHIVFFQFKDFAENAPKEVNIKKVNDLLASLPPKIKEIKRYEHGPNFSESPNAMDMCLVSGFDSVDDLNKYRFHPAHLEVLDFVKKVVTELRAVDFEL